MANMNNIPASAAKQAAQANNQKFFHITNPLYAPPRPHGLGAVLHPLQRMGIFPQFHKSNKGPVAGTPSHPVFNQNNGVYNIY